MGIINAVEKLNNIFKPKNNPNILSNYVVVDVETTGLSPSRDKIIELSALLISKNKVISRFDVLINPEIKIPDKIVTLTGITDQMVKRAYKIDNVIPRFIKFVGDSIIVGHNVRFDLGFITLNCEQLGLKFDKEYVDTLEYSKIVMPELEHHKLCDLCSALNVVNKNSHRALSDCFATFACFEKMMSMSGIKPEIKLSTADDYKKHPKYPKNYTEETRDLQVLNSIIKDITCDDVLTESEVFELKSWIDANKHLCGNYPYDRIEKAISKALEDGILEKCELEDLLILLKDLESPKFDTISDIDDFKISNSAFCLTGTFKDTKSNITSLIEQKGGAVKKTVSGKTNYVIVGSLECKEWKCGNYGEKIKKAFELKDKGNPIKIISEDDFLRLIN